jgi:hypothetical protein
MRNAGVEPFPGSFCLGRAVLVPLDVGEGGVNALHAVGAVLRGEERGRGLGLSDDSLDSHSCHPDQWLEQRAIDYADMLRSARTSFTSVRDRSAPTPSVFRRFSAETGR